MADAHFICALKQDTTVVDGIVESSLSPGVAAWVAGSDGAQYPTIAVTGRVVPTARFTTLKVAAAITQFGVDGQAIDTDALELYTRDAANLGARGSTGEKLTVTKGILVPTSLTAGTDDYARVEYAVFAGGGDTDTAPVTVTSDQAIPTSGGVSELYTLGAVELNGASVGPVQTVTIDFGFDVRQQGGDGWTYPRLVYWTEQRPTITVETLMPGALSTVALEGTTNTITVELQRVDAGDTQTFSTHQNLVHVDTLGGTHGEPATTTITCLPVYDGTNAPITVS